ncbi:MAG: hypothetical protein M3O06_02105, partial [Pseudomonadota bacterium]|nr:hypothetical protein [Pseudomonadota bacterium]
LLSNGHILAVNNSQRTAEFTSTGARVSPVVGGTVATATHGGTTVFRADGTFLVVAGGLGPSGENDTDVSVLLFYPSGESDPNFLSPLFDFGNGGPYANLGQAIALGPTGEIAVGGLSETPSFNQDFGIARLHSDGALDSRFANRGTTTTFFPHGGQVLAILIQPDAKILAVGQAFSNDTGIPVDLAMARYLTQ